MVEHRLRVYDSAMQETDIRGAIRTHILTEVIPGEDSANLEDDMPLRTSGVLDSMATLKLVQFVEDSFDITVDAHEAGVNNFDRVTDLVAFVLSKRTERGK